MRALRSSRISVLLIVHAAGAQTGAIRGTVKDATSGVPVPDVSVTAGNGSSVFRATTDKEGSYSISGLPASQFRISVYAKDRLHPLGSKAIDLRAAQSLTSVDFRISAAATVSGKATDESGKPVETMLWLLTREYRLGESGYVFRGIQKTDSQGEFTVPVDPGRQYLLLATGKWPQLQPATEPDADPRRRPPILGPTYYFDSDSAEGGVPLLLRPQEQRQDVSFRVRTAPSYCIEGTTEADGRAVSMEYSVLAIQPPNLFTRDHSMSVAGPTAKSDSEGWVHICGLAPGDYRLSLPAARSGAPRFGVTTVRVSDRDVRGVVLSAQPGSPLSGRVLWHGAQPEPPDLPELTIGIIPLHRPSVPGESGTAHSTRLGEFTFPSLLLDDYQVLVSNVPPGVYIKDVSYGGQSMKARPLRFGSAAAGSELQVLLARDGSALTVRVTDTTGEHVADASVVVVPEGVTSEAALAAAIIGGQTDQNGFHTTATLAPGRYYVLASRSPVDTSLETIGRIWRAYRSGEEVDIASSSQARLTISRIME